MAADSIGMGATTIAATAAIIVIAALDPRRPRAVEARQQGVPRLARWRLRLLLQAIEISCVQRKSCSIILAATRAKSTADLGQVRARRFPDSMR